MEAKKKKTLQNENISAITSKLFGMILKMSGDERIQLLSELETRYDDKKRKHDRRDYFMVVEYAVGERLYSGFIKNISPGGLFIEMDINRKINSGDRVTLTFSHPDTGKHIKTQGEVVRIEDAGIGIHFDSMIPLFG